MRTSLAWGLALVLAGCGGSAAQQAAGTGGSGTTSTTGSTGTTGGAGSTGSTGGAGAALPQGDLCPEVTVTGGSCTPNNFHDPLVSYVADSGLIFLGTVTELHAVTTGIPDTDLTRMIVVHVDTVLFDAGMLDLGGQSVTVELLAAPTMAVGYQGYFFTQIWTLGQTVGVTEVAHADPDVYPTLPQDVPGIEALLADEQLYARMQTAGTVIAGTVTAITPLPDTGPVSEHDPIWAQATITADCALRGATPATANVAFATSDDVAWFQAPKLTMGEAGVFLLQPVPSPQEEFEIPDGIPYVVTSPLDVQPPSARAHVANLVLCPPAD